MQRLNEQPSGGSPPMTAVRGRVPDMSLWIRELIDTFRLALPMAATQLGQVAMMTTDLALIGRLGDKAVAGAALGHTVLFGCFVLGMGLVAAVSPLAAQAFGAREPRRIGGALTVGIWAAVIAGIPLTLIQLQGEPILRALGQDAEAARLAGRYLDGLAWTLVPGWIFIALRNVMSALNRPEPALWITITAIPVNAALAYALINGAFGLPRLDILGAGIATSLVNLAMCAAAFWITGTWRPFRRYRVLALLHRPDMDLMRRLVALGLPISGAFALEYGLFAGAALLMGRIGTSELAAHQIALQTASILFMVPFGVSMAATVRVGQALGRGDLAAQRRAGMAAIVLGIVFMTVMTALVVIWRNSVPALFLDPADPANADTLPLAAMLLLVASTFFIVDGIQTVAAGALRGLNDTRVPLVMAALSFWGIGFTSAYMLAFVWHLGAIGIWAGLTLGLVTFALMLTWRFERMTRARRLAA